MPESLISLWHLLSAIGCAVVVWMRDIESEQTCPSSGLLEDHKLFGDIDVDIMGSIRGASVTEGCEVPTV